MRVPDTGSSRSPIEKNGSRVGSRTAGVARTSAPTARDAGASGQTGLAAELTAAQTDSLRAQAALAGLMRVQDALQGPDPEAAVEDAVRGATFSGERVLQPLAEQLHRIVSDADSAGLDRLIAAEREKLRGLTLSLQNVRSVMTPDDADSLLRSVVRDLKQSGATAVSLRRENATELLS